MAMVRCPNCETMANNDTPFCPNCGNRLPQQEPAQPAQPVEAAYQPPVYEQPMVQPTRQPVYVRNEDGDRPGNGVATAGMTLGIISAAMLSTLLVGIWLDMTAFIALGAFVSVFSIFTALPGMGLSIGGVCRRNLPKGKAVAGLVLNTLVLLTWVLGYGSLMSIIEYML